LATSVRFFGGGVQPLFDMTQAAERILAELPAFFFALDYTPRWPRRITQCGERRRAAASAAMRSFVSTSSFRLVVEGVGDIKGVPRVTW